MKKFLFIISILLFSNINIITAQVSDPTCSLTTNKNSYTYGENISFSWTSQNATYATFQSGVSGKDNLSLPGDKLYTSGSQSISADVVGNPTVTLLVYNQAGVVGSCSTNISVVQKTQPTPTCSLTTNKNSYTYGENI